MIEISKLSYQYPQNGFGLYLENLSIPSGGTVAVIGPSGCGKTTLLNLIAGILKPDAGRIVVADTPVYSIAGKVLREFRLHQCGLVLQDLQLVEHLNVLDNILLPCRISTRLRVNREKRDHARELAETMKVGGFLNRHVNNLSQGQRQRVAICRALLLNPPVLLCDEPTASLDPRNKLRVMDRLFQQIRDTQTTLLVVTHDHHLLEHFDQTLDGETLLK